MRRRADSIGRPAILLALTVALCCLTGCEAVHAWQNLDNNDGPPLKWMNGGTDQNELDAYRDLSLSGALSEPSFVYLFAAVRPAG
jgi:hypothetical protein